MKIKKQILNEASLDSGTAIVNGLIRRIDNLEAKEITKVAGEDFDNLIDDVYDCIQTLSPGGIKVTKDVNSRKDMLKDIEADPNNDVEKDYIELQAKQHQKLNNETRIRQYSGDYISLPTMTTFEKELLKAAKIDEVKHRVTKQTWAKPNRHHTNDGIIMRGTITELENQKELPVYVVFMDCSGSFNESDINRELAVINKLEDFEDRECLKVVKKFFSDDVYDTFAEARQHKGSTAGGPDIYDWVKENQPANLIVITDRDLDSNMTFQYSLASSPALMLQGNVWFIWKSTSSPRFMSKFKGKTGNHQYSLN